VEPLFFELDQILKQQRETVRQLLGQSEAQNQALRKNNVELLNNAVQQLTKLSGLMAEQDNKRQEILDKLAHILNLKQGFSISDLLPEAPASLKTELQKVHTEIKNDLQQLKELTTLNSLLTRRALMVNQSLLNIFRGGGQTYQPGAKLKQDKQSLGVLNKIV